MTRRRKARPDPEEEEYDFEDDDEDDEVPVSSLPRPGTGKKWGKLNAAFAGDDEFSFSSVMPDKRKKPPTNIRPEAFGKPEENQDHRGFFVRVMRKIFTK